VNKNVKGKVLLALCLSFYVLLSNIAKPIKLEKVNNEYRIPIIAI
jgi:hypothetical protein